MAVQEISQTKQKFAYMLYCIHCTFIENSDFVANTTGTFSWEPDTYLLTSSKKIFMCKIFVKVYVIVIMIAKDCEHGYLLLSKLGRNFVRLETWAFMTDINAGAGKSLN